MSLRYKQYGISLIELLISLTIGLLIVIVAVQLFITGLSSFNLQKGLGDVNDNGRFGLEFLAKNIQPAGYATTNNYDYIVTRLGQIPGATASTISQNNTLNVGLGTSDQLVVQRWVPSTVESPRDCEGNIVPNATNEPGVFMVSRYFLRTDTQTNAIALACDAGFYTEGAASITGYGDEGVVLISYVDNFQVLYGIGTATSTTPTRFVTSAQYDALYVGVTDPRIVAVRVGTIIKSAEKAGNIPAAAADINILGEVVSASAQNAAGQGFVRRLFVKTIALRNS